MLSVVLGALVVGVAVWLNLLDDTIVDNNLAWALITAVLAWLVLLAIASRLGPVRPTFAEAGQRWAAAAVRFGPTALVGYIAGWVAVPAARRPLQQAVHAAVFAGAGA